MRPRPLATLDHMRLLVGAPHSYSFPSGHTTSAFAAASAAALVAKRLLERVAIWGWVMLALAAAISYSRIYVGVHWPTDVAAGVMLGLASGWVGFRLAFRGWGRKPPKPSPERMEEPEKVPQVQYIS
jgi:undecaprenyl-diphosphatase